MQTDITQMGRWSSFQPFVTTPTRPKIAPGRPIFQAASIQRILRPPQHQFYPINWVNSMVHPFWLKLDELTWRLIAMALLTHAITPAPLFEMLKRLLLKQRSLLSAIIFFYIISLIFIQWASNANDSFGYWSWNGHCHSTLLDLTPPELGLRDPASHQHKDW